MEETKAYTPTLSNTASPYFNNLSPRKKNRNYREICLYCLGFGMLCSSWSLFFILGYHFDREDHCEYNNTLFEGI